LRGQGWWQQEQQQGAAARQLLLESGCPLLPSAACLLLPAVSPAWLLLRRPLPEPPAL
jgi:hypothetical protein